MKRLIFCFYFMAFGCLVHAQTNNLNSSERQTIESQPWHCMLKCEELSSRLVLDLYKESVNVPSMEMFGPMHGYLGPMSGTTEGKVYGYWTVTSCDIVDDTQATLRLSNDLGSDTQECILTQVNDSVYKLVMKGSIYIKKVANKKLVKVDRELLFKPYGKKK